MALFPSCRSGPASRSWSLTLLGLGLFAASPASPVSAQETSPSATNPVVLVVIEGKVEVSPDGTRWFLAATNQTLLPGDRLRTGQRSRATIRWSNLTLVSLDQNSGIQVPPPEEKKRVLKFLKGVLYFFHRDKPALFPVETPTMAAVVRGTEFNLSVSDDLTSTLQMIDGQVEVSNAFGRQVLSSGQAVSTPPGQPPRPTAAIDAINVIQWRLYYPGVLDVDELPLTPAEQQALNQSLQAYRAGDLPAARALYPQGRQPQSDVEKVYLAALVLSVGQVTEAQMLLDQFSDGPARAPTGTSPTELLARALFKTIAAVKFQPAAVSATAPTMATEWLADSYWHQSQSRLEEALAAARQAVTISPRFGLAWARLAELEFSFGHHHNALAALDQSLPVSPRNAQALALKGFVLAAQNQIGPALGWFEQAIALDGALANGWAGDYAGFAKER